MTVYPQSYLTPKSQPWGRAVDKRLHDVDASVRLNALNTNNNLKQLNSSVDLLGRQQSELEAQQAYLATFKTYVSTSPGTSSTSTTGSDIVLKNFNNTFTLTRTSALQIVLSAEIYGNAYANANPSPMYIVKNQIEILNPAGGPKLLDSGVFANTLNVYMSGPSSGGVASFNSDGRTIFLTLNAGTYTANAKWIGNIVSTGGSIWVSNASCSISVIG
jgi:hypothetical protein